MPAAIVLYAGIGLLTVAWLVTAVAIAVGPSSSTPLARLLLWRVAPAVGVAGFILVATGMTARLTGHR
ncbi:MAG: hypothetical protein ACYDAY_09555 [Candidatus Dormibacteria bacterium]